MDAYGSGLLAPWLLDPECVEVVNGTDPAAGVGFSFDYPQARIVVPLALTFKFVTDANAANRTVRIEYDDGRDVPFYREVMGSVQTASTTGLYSASYIRGASDFDTNNLASLPLCPLPLVATQALEINVTNIQATDQISNVVMTFYKPPLRDD